MSDQDKIQLASTDFLSSRRINVDRFYTNLSIGIAPDQELIGDNIFPVLQTVLSRELIRKFGTEAWRMEDDLVGDFSEPKKIDIKMDKLSVDVDGHAKMAPVGDREQLESLKGPALLDLETRKLYVLKQQMLLRREFLQAQLAQTVAAYGSNTVDLNVAPHQWSSDVDPLDDIVPVIQQTIPKGAGRRPNTFWCGQEVWTALIQNPTLRRRIFGQVAPGPIPSEEQFSALIGGLKVVIGRPLSRDDSAGGNPTYLWGKSAGLVYVPPTAGQEIPAFGYTVEQAVFGASSEAVTRIRDEKMGASGGWWLKRSHFYTPAITFPAAGFLFQNAVA